MTALDTPITVDISRDTSTHVRLQGRWLVAARAAWTAVVGMTIALFVIGLPIFWNDMNTPCDSDCATRIYALSVKEAADLEGSGATIQTLAGVRVALAVILMVVSVVVAIAMYRQRSDDPVALLISAMLVTYGVYNSLVMPSLAAALPFLAVPAEIVTTLGFVLVALFGYFFPDGRFVPRWTVLAIPVMLVTIIMAVILPDINGSRHIPGTPRFHLLTYVFGLLLAVLAQGYRYLRVSTPLQRRQTVWVLAGLAGLILIRIGSGQLARVLFPGGTTQGDQPLGGLIIFEIGFSLSALLIPIAFGIAITRYRLWDIDFLINRALIYAGLTAVLGGVFAIGFVGVNTVLTMIAGTQQPLISIGVPALAAAGLFAPAQKFLRRFVDRRFGIKLDYVEAVKVYGGTKREARKTSDTRRDTFGSYTGLTLLGKGGMGEVYRAQHPTLNRSVAIKILPEHKGGDEAEKRFEREAQTVAKLKHSNIVTLHDVGEQDGQPYMVMEYVDGQDLSDMLRQHGNLPVSEALPILSDVAAALDYAHSQGVIHRDIKPSNVMVEKTTASGSKSGVHAVLMDFGIAKSYASTRLTQSGGMIGTLDYISPEQIQGAAEVDARADIYSFGVMAYQVLTGKLPFAHNNPGAMVLAHLNQPPPDPREIIPSVPEIAAHAVMRAMGKKPDQRFDTAGAFVAAMSA